MKIAFVLSKPPAYSETFLRAKIIGLQHSGMNVRIYCRERRNDFDLCPVVYMPRVSKNPLVQLIYFVWVFTSLLPKFSVVRRYITLERKEGVGGFKLLKRVYLNSHLLKANVDWVHFGFATLAVGSETVARAIRAKLGVSFRGFDMGTYPVKNPGCYDVLWKYVDQIHTNSNDLWKAALRFGMPEGIAVKKITPAINTTKFQAELPRYWNDMPIVFMTTGRLHWKKGFVLMLEALAILKKEGFSFTYKIVGDGPEYERIAFAAYELGLQDEVKFLGRVPHKEVREHLETATIYLQYSVQEGFCNAVLEAQAMGKLCVVSDAEGLAENVLHGDSGWVVHKYNPKKFAKQIREVLLLSPEEKSKIAQNAMDRVREHFTVEQQDEKFREFYNRQVN